MQSMLRGIMDHGILGGEKVPGDKDFFERLAEPIKEDKELHDATVRVLNSFAEMEHQRAEALKRKNERRR